MPLDRRFFITSTVIHTTAMRSTAKSNVWPTPTIAAETTVPVALVTVEGVVVPADVVTTVVPEDTVVTRDEGRVTASTLANLTFPFSSSGWHQAQFFSSSGSCPVTHSVAKTSVGSGLTSQDTLETSFIESHMTFLPEHIWKDVKDYETFRPWEEPHPTVKGLTKLIGQGPFIFSQADLAKYVKLVWNPLYVWKNPEKPGLIEKQSVPSTATAGETITVQYWVLNFTRQPITAPDANFKLQVKRSNGTVLLDLSTSYANGTYEAKVDTGTLGAGDYICQFNAAPYGLDTFSLSVGQPPPPTERPSWILPAVGAITVVVVAATVVVIVTKRRRRHVAD